MATPLPAPGAPTEPEDLTARLAAAAAARPGPPRTRHRHEDGSPRYVNRLVLESSPYLLQHAHNPVAWHPWGDEAFAAARARGVPVLLSVGYSTCHWCHVMEEESFEDEEVAAVLNALYLPIKVDREERPDLDAIYMSAVQLVSGHGGWPMTVWLTPERRPYFGGTYFPARDGDRGARVGFVTLLRRLRAVYDERGDDVATAATRLHEGIREQLAPPAAAPDLPGPEPLFAAADHYADRFDQTWGGLATAPKFPSHLPARLLLRAALRAGRRELQDMAVLTLEKMHAGGMYDHVGGGFHRYSTDRRWLVPHFEKMLYDNALLVPAYLEAAQAAGRADFLAVARDVLGYVARELTAPEGGFWSATDADSPTPSGAREEGWFFTWTPAELEDALGPGRARVAAAAWDVTPEGNFEGRSVLHRPQPDAAVARLLDLPEDRLRAELDGIRAALYTARARRIPPERDDKVLAAWNGLMISACAQAAVALGDDAWAAAAARAADFVLTHMRADRRLLRVCKDGRAKQDAFLEDHAFLIAGLLDLLEATGEPRWLDEALALDRELAAFADPAGGFFRAREGTDDLLVREKPLHDGAEPSGNSVATMNLLRLAELTGDDRFRARADRALAAFGKVLEVAPAAMAEMLLALDRRHAPVREILIVAPRDRAEAEPFLARLRARFLPHRALLVTVQGEAQAALAARVPWAADRPARDGRATAYVCERGACRAPTTDPEAFDRQLAGT